MDLRAVFGNREALATKTILDQLIQIEDAPWADMRGKPLDARALSRHLEEYGIKREQVRFSSSMTGKGYRRASLVDAWNATCPLPIERKHRKHICPSC